MRKTIFITVALLCAGGTWRATYAQFVTLKGTQFKLNGEDFYPRVMNYPTQVMYLTEGNQNTWIVKGPPRDPYETEVVNGSWTGHPLMCTDAVQCNAEILADFNHIRDMGFNTVRLALRLRYFIPIENPQPTDLCKPPPSEWEIVHPSITDLRTYTGMAFGMNRMGLWNETYVPMQHPYDPDADWATEKYFDLIGNLLALAEAAELKVILIAGNGARYWHLPPTDEEGNSSPNPYADYLLQLGRRFATNEALMAYDLLNEPGDQKCDRENINKKNVCQYVNRWVDALHVHDHNHLTTIGTHGWGNIFSWDPMCMNVDFLSPHHYFDQKTPGLENMLRQFKGSVHWLYRHWKKPWIIGETGFKAEDNRIAPYNVFPYLHGTEAEQAVFARESQQYVWDCNGSGYSWWNYQDGRPFDFDDPYVIGGEGEPEDNWWGLLHKGFSNATIDPTTPEAEKLAVNEFRNFWPQLAPRGECVEPDNYYNPFNHDNDGVVTKTVEDQNENLLGDAVVTVWSSHYTPEAPYYLLSEQYTFSNGDGVFGAIPVDDPIPDINSHVAGIKISALGAEVKEFWNCCADVLDPIDLGRVEHAKDDEHVNETHHSGQTAVVGGSRNLKVENVVVQSDATVELKAGESVHIPESFEARQGSETHIHCEDPLDCNEFDAIAGFQGRYAGPTEEEEVDKMIEVKFRKPDMGITVSPNPSTGLFTVSISDVEPNDGISTSYVRVLEATGRTVLSKQAAGRTFVLDLGNEAKGLYFLHVRSARGMTFNKPLILQ